MDIFLERRCSRASELVIANRVEIIIKNDVFIPIKYYKMKLVSNPTCYFVNPATYVIVMASNTF